MKNILLFIALISTVSYGQKLTYQDIEDSNRRPSTRNVSEYISKDGISFKEGETLTIGEPSGDLDRYAYIIKMDAIGSIEPVDITARDWVSEIIKFKMDGSRRQGWEIVAVTKTKLGLARYYIDLESAIEYGEIKTSLLSREDAIDKLKEAKDLLDLEMMTQKEYDALKEKLTPIIMDK